MSLASIFEKVKAAVDWFGKEIGKAYADLPKVIRLTEDAEKAATTALPEAIAVIKDAGDLVTAMAKDSGVFLTSFTGLSVAIAAAIEAKALSITADEGVAAAFENFCQQFKASNIEDVLAALHKLGTDAKTLDDTVIATLEKMKADAAS